MVAENGMADGGKVHPDLVCPPGRDAYRQQACLESEALPHVVLRDRGGAVLDDRAPRGIGRIGPDLSVDDAGRRVDRTAYDRGV